MPGRKDVAIVATFPVSFFAVESGLRAYPGRLDPPIEAHGRAPLHPTEQPWGIAPTCPIPMGLGQQSYP